MGTPTPPNLPLQSVTELPFHAILSEFCRQDRIREVFVTGIDAPFSLSKFEWLRAQMHCESGGQESTK